MTLMFKFISGKYKGGEFPLDKDMIVVGRHSELDMVLSEDMVSRKHARILVSGENIILEDMGSTNGTFVNGSRIKKIKLKLHDRILIGSSIAKLVDNSDTGQNMEDAAKVQGSTNAVSGSIEDIPIPEVLQLLVTSKKTGVLKVTMGTIFAEIYLIQGVFKDVIMLNNDLEPKKILFKLIKLESGHFEFEQKDPSGFNDRLDITLDAFLLEAAKYEDEVGLDDIELEDIDDDLDLDDFDEVADASDDIFDLEDEGSADMFDLEDLEEEPKKAEDDVFSFDDLDDDNDDVFDLDDLEDDKNDVKLNNKENKSSDIFSLDEDDDFKKDSDFNLDDLDEDDDFNLDDLDDEPKKQEPVVNKKDDDFNLDDLDDDFDLNDLSDKPKEQEELNTNKKDDDFSLDDFEDEDEDDDFSLDDLDDKPKKEKVVANKKDDDFNLDDLDDDDDFDLNDLDDEPKKQEETPKGDDFGLDDFDDDDFDLNDLDDEPKKQKETPKDDDFGLDDFKLDNEIDDLSDQEEVLDDKPIINLKELKERFPDEAMYALPLPIFSPLDELTKDQLKVLQLVHNFGSISDIIENTELTIEDTYSTLDFLLEEDYIEQ